MAAAPGAAPGADYFDEPTVKPVRVTGHDTRFSREPNKRA
tara:strand:- start:723 stop:842 length:120 start_codon:yes stop_codon:yes gene_type:complete